MKLPILVFGLTACVTSAAADERDLGVLGVHTYDAQTMVDSAIQFPRLETKQFASVDCKLRELNTCKHLPASAQWLAKRKGDAQLLRSLGITFPAYKNPPSISIDGAKIVSSDVNTFSLVALKDQNHVTIPHKADRTLVDYEWIGVKGCFLLLTKTYVLDLKPWNWLAAFSGHPVQRDTYYLELRDPVGEPIAESVVVDKVQGISAWLTRVPAPDTQQAEQEGALPPQCQ